MELLNWDGSLSVGIDIIDEEHLKLTSYINKLHAAIERGSEADVLKEMFEELMAYTISHFEHEEALFKDTGYPVDEQEAHIKEHENLKARMIMIQNRINSGDKIAVSQDLMVLLVEWLVKHTQGVDTRYVPYVKNKISGS